MTFLSTWQQSEIPLQCEGGIHEEGFVVDRIINEVITDFHLGAYAEVIGHVIPQLRLGENDELAVTIGLLTTPEIDKTRE